MSDTFTLRLTGRAVFEGLSADDVELPSGFDVDPYGSFSSSVEVDDIEVESATVNVTADVSAEVEVDASDMTDYDATEGLTEALGYQSASVSGVESEVIGGPLGYDVLSDRLGQTNAIDVLSDLAANGLVIILI